MSRLSVVALSLWVALAACGGPDAGQVRVWVQNSAAHRVFVFAPDLFVQADADPGTFGIAYAGEGPVQSSFSVVGPECVGLGDVVVSATTGDLVIRVGEATPVVTRPGFLEPPWNGQHLPEAPNFACPE